MPWKWISLLMVLSLFLVSCAAQTAQDKDLLADDALGTSSLEDEAAEAQEVLEQSQLRKQREQQELLERQITDPNF
jgi:hypothetical protein